MTSYLHRRFALGAQSLALLFIITLALPMLLSAPARAADTFNWDTNRNRVTADIKSGSLLPLLKQIGSATGWQIFLEPDTTCTVSAKFDRLPPGEALRLLLRDLNFALVPQTNSASRLFVFRTTMQNATQSIRAGGPELSAHGGKIIPNELIVRLKPGANIDEIARLLGAKVIGRIDSLNAYRLQFEDAAAAEAALAQLTANPDVTSVESNFSLDRPAAPRSAGPLGSPPLNLQLKPPPADGRIIVGVVDTAMQPLCGDLNQFLLKPISVAGAAQPAPSAPTHGTAMAETVLRSVQAMTKGKTAVQILPVDVYGPNPTTSSFDVANGIVQAVNGGARIINLSLGSQGDSPILRSVVQDVRKQNIPVFAAAGNEPVTTPFYPAAYPEVTAVTAIDQGRVASYANRGSFVSLGTPGTSIVCHEGANYFVVGTSAASAFASGIAAGYLDATQNSVAQMQSFMQGSFGVQMGPGQ
ncbi:MAG TPA: S8 family serine peptidase [Candidatus Paceibacterota bacterium]|nr:S8 family serine peptidase [Verrucomicrobiota bacterium]HSA09661.1 S8 family serine peptidase [Candidatus Paceibacterota bacterium]